MRIIIYSLLVVGVLAPWSVTISQSADVTATPQETSPSVTQLLHTEVGATHIPVQTKPTTYVNPYANNSDAIVEGRKLFNSMNCVGCHAPQGGGGMGPPLSDADWIYGGRPEQIYLTIMQGRPNGMPAFGSILPDDSIWKLVAYIKTLNSPPTPSKPSE